MSREPRRIAEPVLLLTQRKGGERGGGGGRRPDRRVEPRSGFDDKVVVYHRDEAGTATRTSAWGLNLSRSGIRLMMPDPLAEGDEVGVGLRGARSLLAGRVVWVSRREDGCVAGIAFAR